MWILHKDKQYNVALEAQQEQHWGFSEQSDKTLRNV